MERIDVIKKDDIKKEDSGEKKDIFKVWADSYTSVSKIWEESYVNLYKPWIESTGEMYVKAVNLSKGTTPEKYKEFYEEWIKTQQKAIGEIYPFPAQKFDRETIVKILSNAEETNNLFKSWIDVIEENSRKTQELLAVAPDPEKYRDNYYMWMKSYEKIFDEFLSLPAESTKEIFESFSGVPNIYLKNIIQMSKIWKNTFMDLYSPWVDPIMKLSSKMMAISKGNASSEDYKEFYELWMNTYQEIYGRMMSSHPAELSKEMLENFLQSTNIYLNMYKSWIAALEKLAKKVQELSGRTSDTEAYKEFYDLWIKTYEKAFDDFFENMPTLGPMKEMMEPVKSAAKIYGDTFVNVLNARMKSGFGAARKRRE
ncbi:MAG: hypothetical protein J5U17_08950 [Candidatus Methanoperedens sp.]|nr:hypothetical protein [Candidatus Methanoperedens sp.]